MRTSIELRLQVYDAVFRGGLRRHPYRTLKGRRTWFLRLLSIGPTSSRTRQERLTFVEPTLLADMCAFTCAHNFGRMNGILKTCSWCDIWGNQMSCWLHASLERSSGILYKFRFCGLLRKSSRSRQGSFARSRIPNSKCSNPYISHYLCMIGQICDETCLLFFRCGTPWRLETRECLNDYLTTKVAKRSRWALE